MRGKVPVFGALMLIGRITPAYAGKRQLSTPHTPCTEDHPRLCGEKKHYILPFSVAIGSPPPMRGKEIDWNFNPVAYKDHPRLCGEKYSQNPK